MLTNYKNFALNVYISISVEQTTNTQFNLYVESVGDLDPWLLTPPSVSSGVGVGRVMHL